LTLIGRLEKQTLVASFTLAAPSNIQARAAPRLFAIVGSTEI
jgi:hypothetical protein